MWNSDTTEENSFIKLSLEHLEGLIKIPSESYKLQILCTAVSEGPRIFWQAHCDRLMVLPFKDTSPF